MAQMEKLPQEWVLKEMKFKVGEEDVKFDFGPVQPISREVDVLTVQKALKAKDDGDVSDAAYHELKSVNNSQLPSLCSLIKERVKLNSIIEIQEFNESTVKGCKRKICDILSYLAKDQNFFSSINGHEAVLNLRFSGDGRKTTRKLGSTMTTFSVPAESSTGSSRSPDLEYCISIYDGKEDRNILSEPPMKQVYSEMSELAKSGICLNNKQFQIFWLLCADWKFMAMLLGINSPCSDYFCLWCECCKALLRDFSIEDWPIQRSIKKCCELAAKSDGNKFGVNHAPLVPIEFEFVIPDTLHLMLRIRGKLLNQVACWAIQQKKKAEMERAMLEIGVKFEFYDVQDEGGKSTTKWSSLDCDDLENVVKNLKLADFLSNMADKSKTSLDCLNKKQLVLLCQKYKLRSTGTKDILRANLKHYFQVHNITFKLSSIQTSSTPILDVLKLTHVWNGFEILCDALKANIGDEQYLEPTEFQEKARKWAIDFREATFDEDVTPYMHVLVYHVPQFLAKFGTIHQINCQTVEKKNHLQNKTFHRGSQKGGKNSNYTVQVMGKENRSLYYRVNNVHRQKRKYNKQ